MSAAPDPEEIRLRALELLNDERARLALEKAVIRLHPEALRWEASDGDVRAHRISLGLDGASLGDLDEHPSSLDALESALARAVARSRGHSLAALDTWWELEAPENPSYRAPERRLARRSDPEALRRALISYLLRREQGEAARWVVDLAEFGDLRRVTPLVRAILTPSLARLNQRPAFLDAAGCDRPSSPA